MLLYFDWGGGEGVVSCRHQHGDRSACKSSPWRTDHDEFMLRRLEVEI
jgi:hypothetical protein